MFCAGFHDINSCRLDAGMTEQVRQFRDIFFEVVKCPRKQVPQVVGENFLPGHIGALAQGFEQFPDRYAAQRLANTGKKHRTGMNAVFLAPTGQAVAELSGQQDLPAFAFAADRRLVPADGFCRDKLQFRHTGTGGAKRFQQQLGALVAGGACGVQQAEILGAGQFPARVGEDPALVLERLSFASHVVDALLVIIDGSQHRVDGGRGIALFGQAIPPGCNGLAGRDVPCPGIGKKAGQGFGVLLDGGGAVLPVGQPGLIGVKNR